MHIIANKFDFKGNKGNKGNKSIMPRPVKIPITKKKTANGTRWQLSVPAELSPSGKRWRPSFDSSETAKLKRNALLEDKKVWGAQATQLKPWQAEDARRALTVLKGYDVSLHEAAKHWLAWKKKQEKSCTFAELWLEYSNAKMPRISEDYAADLTRYSAPLLEDLGSEIVSDLEAIEIEKAIERHFPTDTKFDNVARTIRPAFTLAVKRKYCTENPFTRIDKRKARTGEPPEIISPAKAEAMLSACKDHRSSKKLPKTYRIDCTECLPAVALLLFAGVRPREIERLQWEDVRLNQKTIRIRGTVAKTRSHRNITIQDNLAEWLELTPKTEREGPIIPRRWRDKIKAVRKASNVTGQDVCRHSFASYALASHNDLKQLQSDMGHNTPNMILDHYRAAVDRSEAVAYWSIRPDGKGVKLKSA